MNKYAKLAIAGALVAVSTAASANLIQTFTANGVTENVAQQATARFNFASASTFTITLTDNVDPTAFLISELSGLEFTLSQTPTSLTLTGVNAASVIDCSNVGGSSCPPASDIPAFYGWGTTLDAGAMTLGAGYSGSDFGWAPFDIVNQNYVAPGSGGLSDPANNPLLVGPVVFTFQCKGLAPCRRSLRPRSCSAIRLALIRRPGARVAGTGWARIAGSSIRDPAQRQRRIKAFPRQRKSPADAGLFHGIDRALLSAACGPAPPQLETFRRAR